MYKIKKIPNKNKDKIKISFLGDSGVGKTTILYIFLGLEINRILKLIGIEKLEDKIKLNNGKEIKLILWDTAGTERFRSITIKNIKFSEGCVIVFDVTSKKSFENLSIWLDLIKKDYPNVMVFIFGNKVDYDKSEWEITNEEINKFIEEKKLKYFEVSAKNKNGINEGFNYIANELCKEVKKEYIVIEPKKK